MSNTDYLLKEYELCFEQLRYYDTRHTATLKYLVSLASAVATALFALYKYFKAPNPEFYNLQSLLSVFVWVGSLLLYLSMVANRVYYIRIACQVNMIREFYLKSTTAEFRPRNQLWRSSKIPMFHLGSLHAHQLIGAALTSSAFFGLFVYSNMSANEVHGALITGILSAILCLAIVLIASAVYLNGESKTTVNKDSETGEIEIWPPSKTDAADPKKQRG